MSLFLVYATVDPDGCAQLECEEVASVFEAAQVLIDSEAFPHEARLFDSAPISEPWNVEDPLKGEFNNLYKNTTSYREYLRLHKIYGAK